MRTRIPTIFIFQALLLTALPTGGFAASSGNAPPRTTAAEKAPAQLWRSVSKGRAVDILVEVAVPFRPEGELDLDERRRQRSAIAARQDRVIQDLESVDADAARRLRVKRFEFIPHIALSNVDAEALKALEGSATVKRIQAQNRGELLLDQSVRRVGGDVAWQRGYSGQGQTVAVLDTGVDKNHAFLRDKVVVEACYSQNQCPGGRQGEYPGAAAYCDSRRIYFCDHGTQVASIAAGRDPASRWVGVAKDANLIFVTVTSNSGFGFLTWHEPNVLSGLELIYRLRLYGRFNNIAAVNMSLGAPPDHATNCDSRSTAMTDAIENLRSIGIPTAVGSGNYPNPNGIMFPACISSAISVGATTTGSDTVWYRSSSLGTNMAPILSLLAPGDPITAAKPGPDSPVITDSGTSFAAPHVAGALAVLRQRQPNATVDQLQGALMESGRQIYDPRSGITKPRLQVDQALDALDNFSWRPSPPQWDNLDNPYVWTKKVALASWARNHLTLFAINANGDLYQRTYAGSWGAWSQLLSPDGSGVEAIAAASPGPGRLTLVAATRDGALYGRIYSADGWSPWYGWDNPGEVGVTDLAIASSAPDRYDLAAVDAYGELYHRAYSGGSWGSWTYLAGGPYNTYLTDAAITARGPSEVDLFATDDEGLLDHRSYSSGQWRDWDRRWASPDGGFLSRVDATTWGRTRADVVAVDSYLDTIYQLTAVGRYWGELQDQGGSPQGPLRDLAIAAWGPFRLDLVSAADGLGHRRWG